MVEQPRRWNVGFIRNFMIVFGILSSVFDFLTFGVLILVFQSSPSLFRTGWFAESVISASLIVLVIRSRRPFFKSFPGKYLLLTTIVIVGATLIFPFTPLGSLFGFAQPPPLGSSFDVNNCGTLHSFGRSGERNFLQAHKILKTKLVRKSHENVLSCHPNLTEQVNLAGYWAHVEESMK